MLLISVNRYLREPAMTIRELIELKIAMEFGAGPDGDTLPPATVKDEAQPRLLVSRHAEGSLIYFRHDLPAPIRAAVGGLDAQQLSDDEERVKAILAGDAPCERTWRIRWHTVERVPTPDEYPDVGRAGGRFIVMRDGVEAAAAWTAATNAEADEVEVETHPDFRRRGFGRQCVAAWAAATLHAGKVAFYSHRQDNHASAALARSLRLRHLSDDVEYS